MVELVDTLALGASGESHEGSSPSPPTIFRKAKNALSPSKGIFFAKAKKFCLRQADIAPKGQQNLKD